MSLRSFLRSWLHRPETKPAAGGKVQSFLWHLFKDAPEAEQRIPEPPPANDPDAGDWEEWFGGVEKALAESRPGDFDESLAEQWHKMASSNVDEIRYVPDARTLQVLFLNSYAYEYYNVPANVFTDFLRTDSPGRYVWNVLRADGYPYRRVGTGEIPINPTGNRRPVANVVRRLLPEEVERNRDVLNRIAPGQTAEKLRTPLREQSHRNVRGAGTERAREQSRRAAERILERRR